ncbi:MAG: pantetheine-phosphate adenylyltransferase [Pseudomonadota bacterium]
MSKQRIGVYPGTFDPITKGHIHIIKRASKLVDKLVIGVAANKNKSPLFSHEERLALVKADLEAIQADLGCEIEVIAFDKLLIDFASDHVAVSIVRGLRAVSDFDYEFQMTGMNIHLAPDIETVFLMAADQWQFISSSFVKEIHLLSGDVSEFVTDQTLDALDKKRA